MKECAECMGRIGVNINRSQALARLLIPEAI